MRLTVHGVNNKAVRIFSVVLSICILCAMFSLPSAVSSASSQEELMDIKAHWAEEVILKWVNQGLAKGYGNGRFGPNDSITRAEFVTLLNRIFGYQQASEKSFPDVKAGAWYAAEIAKAYQAGIIGGDNNGNMNPEVVISRQEAAVILTRAFSLAGDNLDAALKYTDVGEIAEWALGSVGTMTKRGYVTGRPGNLFAPKANLSRCEAVKMIDNVMGELINAGGTYTRVVPGNMVISSPGVTLKDTYIAGDLYLTGGIETETIKLIGVAVKGKTIIAGGIENISLTDTLLEQDVLVLHEEGKVTITAEGITEVGTMTICRNAILLEQDLTGLGFRNIKIGGKVIGKEIVLKGDFEDIAMETPQTNVMLETGTVGNIVVDKKAAGARLTVKDGSAIENLTLYAETEVTGGNKIKNAVIASSGVKMDQKPKQVTIAEGGQAIAYHSSQGSTQGQPKPTGKPIATPKPTSKPEPTVGATPTQGPTAVPTPTQGPTVTPTQTPKPDTTPPSVPTNLTGMAISSTVINLNWTASTDNVGVAGYRIFRGGEEIGTSTTITYSDTGLTAGMTYSYAVSAYDATGNVSAPCPVVQVTPQEDDNQSLIPENRRIDWSHAGVPGGIPHRTVIYTTIDPEVYGNGETDASEAINAAIKECPEGQVVYLPAGTYKLSASIHFTSGSSGVTLRGAGPGLTTLVRDSNAAGITTAIYGLNNFMEITGGAVKGSTSIVVSDASSIVPGRILDICQADDPDFYWSRGNIPDHTGQYVMVTAVNGNTVEIEDPLVWTFDKNPRFRSAKSQGVSWIGIEDLTITADASRSGSMIQFSNAYASWIKNVETAWGNGNCHIYLYSCLRCEVRDSYIHDTHSTTDGYGILTMMGYGSGTGGTPRGGCTGMLIENNIFSDLGSSIILESEVGSVVAYNYSRNARASSGWANYQIHDFIGNHGPHGMMCLFEGNVASSGFQQDGYHGSVSHTTLFRNAFSGKHEDSNKTGNIKLIDLCRFSYYHNVIGNVLGNPEWPRDTIGRYEMTGIPGYTAQPVIYRLGYPNMGNNHYSETNPPSNGDSGGLDPKVKETLMRWGNFDYQNNMTKWDSSEIPEGVPVPTDHILPASLVYEEKPEWFGNAPWPAIGPDVDGLVQKIPAELRYEALQSGDTTPPAVPENLSSEVSQTTVNLSWTASTDNVAVVGYRIYRDGIQIGTSATNSYSDTDVTAGETYRYTISAYDAAGNESDQSVCKDVVAVDACILYIRADASSYGAGDGSDWNNAYSGFDEIDWENEMIKPGTIIYFSGGNYTSSIIPQKSGDNSAPIIIKRAVSNDHGTDTGWNAEMDSTAYFMDGAKISTSSREHLIIDGVKDYGIKVLAPYRVCNYAGVLLNGSNNIVQHALIDGNGDDWASVGVGLGGNANTLRYVKIRNTSNDAIKLKGTNHIIEYSIIEPYASNRVANACCSGNVCHADGIEIDGADNITIRYNEFSWPGDTLIFGINGGESDNWDIYGNVWHDGACIMKIQSNNRPQTNIRVYNNTFLNYGSIVLRGQEFDFRNNLFFNTNGIQEGSNIVVTDDPFINSVEGDYRLSKQSLPVNEGEPLSSQYNIDAFGNTRGADGHWDIGAYEYDATP